MSDPGDEWLAEYISELAEDADQMREGDRLLDRAHADRERAPR